MRASCTEWSAKIGRMSSKRIPGDGKSGNWRSAARSFTLRLASSAVREGAEEGCSATWVVVEASGAVEEACWDMLKGKERKEKRKERKEVEVRGGKTCAGRNSFSDKQRGGKEKKPEDLKF